MLSYFSMKVEILNPKAYCAGVSRAIEIARKAKLKHQDKEVYVLGMLVHNNFVVKSLEEEGIKTAYIINDIPDGSVVIFSAHGHKEELDAKARKKKLIVYDSVCPKVLSNIKLIKENLAQGHQIIYIGQEGHPEAEACLSLNKKVILFHKNILKNYQSINDESPLVINQTTLNILDIKDIHEDIKKAFPQARIMDEICPSTRLRQEAIRNLDDDVDLIIVVGDTYSSNTRRLFEIAKQSHPEVASIMISSKDELDASLFANKNHIVISSGASTPMEIIDAVYNKIINY